MFLYPFSSLLASLFLSAWSVRHLREIVLRGGCVSVILHGLVCYGDANP